MAADGSDRSTVGRWQRRVLFGLTAGVLVVPISASAAGAATTGPGTSVYAAKVSGLCRTYAKAFAQAGAKVGSGSPSGSSAAAALSKAVSKAQLELEKITSVPKPKAQAAALRQTFAKAKELLAQLDALAASVKAHDERQVAAKLAAIEQTEAALAKKFGSVGLASCAAGAPTTSTGTQPVLDASVLDSPVGGTSGYGQVKPTGIAVSGTGGTNEVVDVVWSSWGGATATGTGTGCVLQSTGIEANCARTPADVVAYELGACSGKPAYLAMTWYFPSLGQSFTPGTAHPTPVGSACHTTASGSSSTSSTTTVPPTTTTTVPATTPTTTSAGSSSAPCSATAITAVVKAANKDFYALSGYGCTGDFAYASVTVTGTQTDNPIATVTILLMATNGQWQVVSRSYCTQNAVPAGIYQPACESN
jgi:hypothetical protein